MPPPSYPTLVGFVQAYFFSRITQQLLQPLIYVCIITLKEIRKNIQETFGKAVLYNSAS